MEKTFGCTPISLKQIQQFASKLCFDARIMSTLIAIERFDAQWELVGSQDIRFLSVCYDVVDYESFISSIERINQTLYLNTRRDLETIRLWFQTDFEVQPFIRCLVFAYLFQRVVGLYDHQSQLSTTAALVVLVELDYTWVKHTTISLSDCFESQDWMHKSLSIVREQQIMLRRKLDFYGSKSVLTMKQKLLLHIIDNNPAIKTSVVVRKLGVSRATVKRMLVTLPDFEPIR